ncbi:Insect cuticle protein [Trinorchestia longiramus]|nr:Insect cuticle protein [Trinorchestia longiramus]
MRQFILVAALLGISCAMPQQRAQGTDAASQNAPGNPFTRILSFESYQDGANFGHQLFQEDGTTSGQKQGPDGLLYGFYSYIQPDGSRVKVYWRAGQGIGYEVLGVEGLVKENLGNLKATVSASTPPPPPPPPSHRPAPVRAPAPVQNTFVPSAPIPARPPVPVQNTFVPSAPIPARPPVPAHNTFIPSAPTPAPPHRAPPPPLPKPAATLFPNSPIPVVPVTPESVFSRFDYPATLNLERTANGFFSSLTASR